MSKIYEGAARITYFDLDYRGRVRLSALLRMVHVAADVNAGELGVGHSVLGPLGMSFILQRFGIAVTRMPEYEEEVVIRTWPSEVGRGTFGRQGDMYDGAGRKLMEWASLWILFDMGQRRILRPSSLPVVLPEFGDQGVRVEPRKVDLPGGWGDRSSSYVHTVRCCEVDPNMHMNSSIYGDLVDNALFSVVDGGGVNWSRVQINYLAEARLGDEVDVKCCRGEDGGFFVGGVSKGRTVFAALVETA